MYKFQVQDLAIESKLNKLRLQVYGYVNNYIKYIVHYLTSTYIPRIRNKQKYSHSIS